PPHLLAQLRDLRGFGMSRVVLPEPDHRVEVVLELRKQAEGCAGLVHRDGGASRRVDADADDLRGVESGNASLRLIECATHDSLKAIELDLWILARHIRIAG